ncbi:coronin-7-like [Haliotis rufescens]|uniref:coronin-7-like n=1 Tax=Haliotis rufescens TaxID=6454 RepID=UPI00201EB261|nr:coronin-7-like [Haliotis rufescens]XP_046355098.2 coronin-7-like [Haliotis rufescens]XP_046355099.2 coronin-7-like [Haliotis rufescens]XP_048237003.1 coronin-7-like [Haliotis rufescens]
MAWRFKASKYKNSVPKFPKKEEWISELPIGTLMNSQGNHIKASAEYMAFNVDSTGGGSLGILPLSCTGRQGMKIPLLHAHGDLVTDFDFSPFDDYLLATGSSDQSLKVWLLPEDPGFESESNPVVSLPSEERKIENVLWHPAADGVLAASAYRSVRVYDVCRSQEKYALEGHGDLVQSISWKGDGSLLLSSCKDKTLRIFDPRAGSISQETPGHGNIKDSRVLWLGDKDIVMSTGYDSSRSRCIGLWDTRNFSSTLHSISLDTSTGILMPFFDPDTNMVFITGKGDNLIRFLELTDKSPYITEGSTDRTEQVKGLCTVPKRAMDVMNGEVNRLLCLVNNAVIPTPYIVPRKSYRDYHEDIYPPTSSMDPAMSADQWFSGQNDKISLISLDPSKKQNNFNRRAVLLTGGSSAQTSSSSSPASQITNGSQTPKENSPQPKPVITKPKPMSEKPKPSPEKPPPSTPPHQAEQRPSSPEHKTPVKAELDVQRAGNSGRSSPAMASAAAQPPENAEPLKPTKVFTGVRKSKFRHLKGQVLHKSRHIENLRNVSTTVPGESDMFAANTQRCAVPLEGPGGLIMVLELDQPGRLPDSGIPALQNGSKVMDFSWDPFDNHRLAVACDDAKIRIWTIPENGITENMTEVDLNLRGHMEKIYFVRFHPLARDILVSASYDMTVRIWDLTDGSEVMQLEGHTDAVFCFAWSPDGDQCATVCKDGKVRVFEPRKSSQPLREGPGPAGSRGARVTWALGGKYLFVSGFDRNSVREVILYDAADLTEPLVRENLDISPSIRIPFYDEDSSIVFLQGRGDRQVHAYEISEEEPHLFPASGFTTPNQSQAFSFMPKPSCDPRIVEFAFAWRLTKSSIEPLSFTVPRVKTEYFQDDLFPETRVTWEPVMTSSEWFAGSTKKQPRISVRPTDMKLLSEAPAEAPKARKFESYNASTYKTDDQKKDELLSAMDKKLGLSDAPMPQDLAEGVDDDEWDD